MSVDLSEPALEVTFRQLNLIEPLIQALEQSGYSVPTPIQAGTIPLLLAGRDVLGQAQTGTGKTAAFALPMLQRIDPRQEAAAGAGADAHPRTGDPGRQGVRRYAPRLEGSARRRGLRRAGLPDPVPATRSRRAGDRRHAGTHDGPHAPRLAQARRSAQAWCWTRPTRCCGWVLPRTSSGCSPRRRPRADRALLGHHARSRFAGSPKST